ncbi:hypothetical protein M405DRAFT_827490 [Rhizopogon salebrosus TDB-379]|nr:hypothetical protein M405DRAFT_827490 [Rhizopogon salebrosus TDB-379]
MAEMWKMYAKLSASRQAAAIAGDRYSKNMALSKDHRHPLQDVLVQSSTLYLCTWLTFEHNNTISLSTLSHTLEQAGLTRKILQKLAAERGDIRREEDAGSLLTNQTVIISGLSGWPISPG